MRRVLIVEDVLEVRQVVAEYLRQSNYLVDEASNGVEGLARMRESLPDVVLLDLVMPFMDGREFLAACREQCELASVPIIILSGDLRLPQAAERKSARASLVKPVDLDVLRAIVERVVSS
ncbi:MAG TPA: response regulator [Chloroflexota bacterium]